MWGSALLWAVEGVCSEDGIAAIRSASSNAFERVVYVAEGGHSRLLPSSENSQLCCNSVRTVVGNEMTYVNSRDMMGVCNQNNDSAEKVKQGT